MAKGLAVPVRISKSGGLQTIEGKDELRQILSLALSEGDDTNPFQSLGISRSMIFSIADVNALTILERNMLDILRKFSDRIGLDANNPIVFRRTENGEVQAYVRYIDKRTGEPGDLIKQLG